MIFNGLMIDCSRLIESRQYYYELIDFMAEWEMNTLLLHFSDNHGLSVKLEGFEHIAQRNAFSRKEMTDLIKYANSREIDIIPEIETFGHSRYLVDNKKYEHLRAGDEGKELAGATLNPLHPETLKIIDQLLSSTVKLFNSNYVHIGCDETDIKELCKARELDEPEVWVNQVNKIIDLVHKKSRTPMIWGDRPMWNKAIGNTLNKDVLLLDWRYEDQPEDEVSKRLSNYGFKAIIGAPSVAYCNYRFFPTTESLNNAISMDKLARKYQYSGIINTIWCPFRYFQKSIYYALAHCAEVTRMGKHFVMKDFMAKFALKMFKTQLDPNLKTFLEYWPQIVISGNIADKLFCADEEWESSNIEQIKKINKAGKKAVAAGEKYTPYKNKDVFTAMLLSAKAAWLCSEYILLKSAKKYDNIKAVNFNRVLKEVMLMADEDWDKCRCSNDGQKKSPKFPYEKNSFALLILKQLKYLQ